MVPLRGSCIGEASILDWKALLKKRTEKRRKGVFSSSPNRKGEGRAGFSKKFSLERRPLSFKGREGARKIFMGLGTGKGRAAARKERLISVKAMELLLSQGRKQSRKAPLSRYEVELGGCWWDILKRGISFEGEGGRKDLKKGRECTGYRGGHGVTVFLKREGCQVRGKKKKHWGGSREEGNWNYLYRCQY